MFRVDPREPDDDARIGRLVAQGRDEQRRRTAQSRARRAPDAFAGQGRPNHRRHTLWPFSHRQQRPARSSSPGGGGEPAGALGSAIDAAFGSFADFQAKLKAAGVGQFGSGWAWLVHDGSGLAVVGTPNQDNPISAGKTALLGVDVWEHAYYLHYQNRRPDYIDAWWNVVDWGTVAERFAAVS